MGSGLLLKLRMGKIKELHKRLKATNWDEVYAESVVENEKHATELNRQQLFQGDRADGSEMPPYSFVSVNFFNKPNGPIRLYDTGDFYRGFIFASKTGKAQFPLFITSTDSKTNELQSRYGSQIFGLTSENMAGFAKVFVLPSLKKRIEAILHV